MTEPQQGKVYWLNGDPMFTLIQDGETYHLVWHTPPEPVVMMGLKNPEEICCIDNGGQKWNGQYLIHFIQTCPPQNRHYGGINT